MPIVRAATLLASVVNASWRLIAWPAAHADATIAALDSALVRLDQLERFATCSANLLGPPVAYAYAAGRPVHIWPWAR